MVNSSVLGTFLIFFLLMYLNIEKIRIIIGFIPPLQFKALVISCILVIEIEYFSRLLETLVVFLNF